MIAKYLIVLAIAAVALYEQIVARQLRRAGRVPAHFLGAQSAVLAEITRRARAGNIWSQLHHGALLAIGLWICVGLVSFVFFGK